VGQKLLSSRCEAVNMGFLGFFNNHDINHELNTVFSTPGAFLLDVRTPGEFREGHIPGSINIPLQTIDKAITLIENKDSPIFVYCRSGARSAQACSALKHLGYNNTKDLGGIDRYRGKVETSA